MLVIYEVIRVAKEIKMEILNITQQNCIFCLYYTAILDFRFFKALRKIQGRGIKSLQAVTIWNTHNPLFIVKIILIICDATFINNGS